MSTMIAVAVEPEIVCPPWCTVPKAVHLERLWDTEGFVYHDSEFVDGLSYTTHTFVDGVPVPGDVATIYSDHAPGALPLDGGTVDEVEAFAYRLLAVVKAARA